MEYLCLDFMICQLLNFVYPVYSFSLASITLIHPCLITSMARKGVSCFVFLRNYHLCPVFEGAPVYARSSLFILDSDSNPNILVTAPPSPISYSSPTVDRVKKCIARSGAKCQCSPLLSRVANSMCPASVYIYLHRFCLEKT